MKSALYPVNSGIARAPSPSSFLVALTTAILLAACGGGGGDPETKTGVGGTGDPNPPSDALTASGPLSTIGISGIAATGLDDRASAVFINMGAQSFTALKLGMVAEAIGTIPTTATSTTAGTATNINAQSAVVGPVSSLDLANLRFNVVSLTVQVDQNTIFESLSSFASLAVGTRVEVYGLPQPESRSILATRVISLPAVAGTPVELLGVASNVTAFQFTLQGVAVSTAAVSSVTTPTGTVPGTASIVENTRVRVLGSYSAAGNSLAANQIIAGIPIVRNDNTVIVLDGVVQSIGAGGRFRLSDTDVDTTAANAATITVGSRVQIKGRKTAGVLAATDFRRIASGERILFVVQGDIANLVSAANFTVRGDAINATNATFIGGTAANLANGRTVRIKAQVNGGHLEATEVSFVTG